MDSNFKHRKVLIFGLGLNQGGVGSAKFFASKGASLRVTDLKSQAVLQSSIDELKKFPEIEYALGEHKNEDIDWADLIIRNPAVKPGNSYIEYAQKKGKQIETDLGIFLQHIKPNQIIGVTGTKGKSTTASLIYQALKTQKREIILAGNIGKSVLDAIDQITPDTLVILEISSFQLESFNTHQVSPKWAIITNLTPDHLNYYQTMKQYVASKKLIGKYQIKNDFLFIRKNDPIVDSPDFLKDLKANIIRFSKTDLPKNFKPFLKGDHNLENMAAAIALTKTLGVDPQKALKTIQKFKGIPFRMELIKNWHGVKIINDTCASSPEAGIQAIKTFPGCILICGGMNKGMDYKDYVKFLSQNVKAVFFLEGDSTQLIRGYKPGLQLQTFGPYNNLEKLLTRVKSVVKKGETILFSPAATSFNLFQNEFDRGRKFNEAVEKIFHD